MLNVKGRVPEVVRDYAAFAISVSESEGTLGPLKQSETESLVDGKQRYLLVQHESPRLRQARWVKLWCIVYEPAETHRIRTQWVVIRERSLLSDDSTRRALYETIPDTDWIGLIETEIQLMRRSLLRKHSI